MKAARWRAERPLPLLKQSAAAVASMALQPLLRQLFVEALFYLDNQCYGPEKGAHLKCLAPPPSAQSSSSDRSLSQTKRTERTTARE